MDIISYVHKSVELLFQILGLVEVWTRSCMELSPARMLNLRVGRELTGERLESIFDII
jgi:hypothetical protein